MAMTDNPDTIDALQQLLGREIDTTGQYANMVTPDEADAIVRAQLHSSVEGSAEGMRMTVAGVVLHVVAGPDVAELALRSARQGRRVLIVARRPEGARAAIDRVSEALSDADGKPVIRRAAGQWSVELAYGGRIDASTGGPHTLRGRSCDTLLIERSCYPIPPIEQHALLATSSDPELLMWGRA